MSLSSENSGRVDAPTSLLLLFLRLSGTLGLRFLAPAPPGSLPRRTFWLVELRRTSPPDRLKAPKTDERMKEA